MQDLSTGQGKQKFINYVNKEWVGAIDFYMSEDIQSRAENRTKKRPDIKFPDFERSVG